MRQQALMLLSSSLLLSRAYRLPALRRPLLGPGPVSSAQSRLLCMMSGGGVDAPKGDELVSAISADGSISVKAIVTTELVAESSRLQGLGGLAAVALGRALTCSILVAEGLKEELGVQQDELRRTKELLRSAREELTREREAHSAKVLAVPPVLWNKLIALLEGWVT